ncbi:hypothetical protein TrLO_g5893 [Triparma laevis f. longispina]|uniref:Uncharacterized protein n=1 Tax=Triparma laevis f. longispina TaxID=1714387 RepID=A0A9W7AB03_9STRA|nr:hypothetical protein TrLO_g5893 [Triparma laevis f. longispina]
MGGCYLLGVTTDSFTSYSSRSGLQQSKNFWGIEDGGRLYEGRKINGKRIGRSDLARSGEGVIFGSLDSIIIVCDRVNNSLTYFRNGEFIGTLITSLPRGKIYPVVVPFNGGVRVAVTGVEGDVEGCLREYNDGLKVEREKVKEDRRKALKEEKERLINDGKLTSGIVNTLKMIFNMYTSDGADTLSSVEAGRLWYRCGFRLSELRLMLKEKFDRGTVVEIQMGGRGDPQIRVVFQSRKWWYQPQALRSERSGLMESASILMLRGILRSHGYTLNLNQLAGLTVTKTSWKPGDWVHPNAEQPPSSKHNHNLSRIVIEASRSRDSDSDSIAVETTDGMRRFRSTGEEFELKHTSFHHVSKEENMKENEREKETEERKESDALVVNEEILAKLAKVAKLDQSTISSVDKEISTSISLLASYFSSGLPDAIITGLQYASSNLSANESSIMGICRLATTVVKQLYHGNKKTDGSAEEQEEQGEDASISRSNTTTNNNRSTMSIQDLIRDNLSEIAGGGNGSRRDILLALMASARMDEEDSMPARFMANFERLQEDMEREDGPNANSDSDQQPLLSMTALEGLQRNTSGITSSWRDVRHIMRSASARRITTSTIMLIQNGLLLDSLDWVKRAISVGADSKTQDEDGYSVLRIAIALGCSLPIIECLIKAGAAIKAKELEAAATSDQPEILKLLLKHSVYEEGSFKTDDCSDAVKATLQQFLNQQDKLKTAMLSSAKEFTSSLLESFISTALSLSLQNSTSKSLCIMNILLGDSLYYVVHSLDEGSSRINSSPSRRQPPSSLSSFPPPFSRMASRNLPQSASTQAPCHESHSLLAILPPSAFDEMEETSLVLLMRLIEAYLWKKDVKSVSVGLGLAHTAVSRYDKLLSDGSEKPPNSLSNLLSRYGVLEMIQNQIARAETLLTTNSEGGESSSSSSSSLSSGSHNLKCPQNHPASLHLTSHASFRCDVCGKGVALGKVMFGCRRCDYDICESCVDKKEGGRWKWSWCKDKAKATEALFLTLTPKLTTVPNPNPTTNNKSPLSILTESIKTRSITALESLKPLLNDPIRLTNYEFLTYILPALHAATSTDLTMTGGTRTPSPTASRGSPTRRNAKRQRKDPCSIDNRAYMEKIFDNFLQTSSESSDDAMMVDDFSDSNNSSSEKFAVGDTVKLDPDFIESRGVPPGPLTVNGCGVVIELQPGRVFVEVRGQLWTYLRSSLLLEKNGSKPRKKGTPTPPLIRLLHTMLSFSENVTVLANNSPEFSDLQSLIKPFSVHLHRSKDSNSSSNLRSNVHVEPLMPMNELQNHVLRTARINLKKYNKFCKKLSLDRAIVAERGKGEVIDKDESSGIMWAGSRIGRVVAYDDATGTHIIRYASQIRARNDDEETTIADMLDFNGGEARLVMAGRDYAILFRDSDDDDNDDGDGYEDEGENDNDMEDLPDHIIPPSPSRPPNSNAPDANAIREHFSLLAPVGTRIESDVASEDGEDSKWEVYTIVSGIVEEEEKKSRESSASKVTKVCKYNLVSETGKFFGNVPESRLRGRGLSLRREGGGEGGDNDGIFERGGLPITAIRRLTSRAPPSRGSSDDASKPTGVIKRQWSALTDAQHGRPMHLKNEAEEQLEEESNSVATNVEVDPCDVEEPPKLAVQFSVNMNEACVLMDDSNTTLFNALQMLAGHTDSVGGGCTNGQLNRRADVYYNVVILDKEKKRRPSIGMNTTEVSSVGGESNSKLSLARGRAAEREESGESPSLSNVITATAGLTLNSCEGINAACQQSLELLTRLADAFEESVGHAEEPEKGAIDLRVFTSTTLTKKLLDQLEDPLAVVSGALPKWCRVIPIVAPRLFSHESRRMLLERGTFGVSRAVFRQQENKVEVGGLRSRIEAIRQRAIALMQEAFSEDAEDPMALQLQADELYTLEESLKSQVATAFKRQRWSEHWLQSAKGIVRRSKLLGDAAYIMAAYAQNESARRRRLEIQFTGESGFDASSGEQAGVTRGFYADVALEVMSLSKPTSTSPKNPLTTKPKPNLWIPDIDPSGTTVMPTPRANSGSMIGVYPLPIHSSNPNHTQICKHFRMLGRLFASALRDGFLVPLPLSLEFIKLVQSAEIVEGEEGKEVTFKEEDFMSMSGSSNEAMEDVEEGGEEGDLILGSSDLPRPGFLGGEIYALEKFIVEPLRSIMGGREEGREEKIRNLVEDETFCKRAFNVTYSCSFSTYVEGKTFVDPFDVSQKSGFELKLGGAEIPVTIENVEEYVGLCKRWILHEGVIAQARYFRSGVGDFFNADMLSLLTPKEMREDICGFESVENWDEDDVRGLFKLDGGRGAVEAMVAVAAIGGEGGTSLSRRFSSESPTFGFLVKRLVDAPVLLRRKFLTFCTSLPIVTPGLIEITPIVSPSGSFLPVSDTVLPRANTCARRLYFPRFESYEQFERIFDGIVEAETEFKGFHEWSGN